MIPSSNLAKLSLAPLLAAAAAVASCSPKSSSSGAEGTATDTDSGGDDTDTAANSTDTNSDTDTDTDSDDDTVDASGTIAVDVTNLETLALGEGLAFAVPPVVLASGEGVEVTGAGTVEVGLSLLEGERPKSPEACEVRRQVKAGLRAIRGVARLLCYVETDAGNLAFDRKYAIAHDETSTKAIWVQRKTDHLKVSLCHNGTLIHTFRVTGAKDGRLAGSYKSVETIEGTKVHTDVLFDNGNSDANVVRAALRQRTDYPSDGSVSVAAVAMRLAPDLSFAFASDWSKYPVDADDPDVTTWSSTSRVARFGTRLGGVATYLAGDLDGDGTTDTPLGTRAFFDDAGQSLAANASPLFGDGESLRPEVRQLPGAVDATFAPAAFGEDEWDCSGAETITPQGSNDQYVACDALLAGLDDEDCSTAEYSDAATVSLGGADLDGYGDGDDPYAP